jgi:hypothetical protein
MKGGSVPPKHLQSPPAVGADASTEWKLLLDVPSRQPAVGFSYTARALAQIIMESDPQFAVGIFGGWGSGKTTLMRAIDDELDSTRVVSVEFTAWRYEKEEHLIVPLLDTIREALVTWSDEHRIEAETAKRTAATIGKVTRSILAGVSIRVGLPHALEMSFDANRALEASREFRKKELEARVPRSFYHASFRALSDAFAEFVGGQADRRIVVFVDDLDRCLPENALQVLESMKLFFDLPGFVFVVGLDQDIVELVIDSKYGHGARPIEGAERTRKGRISGIEYVKKIFQLPYRLEPVAVEQLKDFLTTAYSEAALPEAQLNDLRERRVADHLRYVVGDAGVNPREIKRYINAYTLQRKISGQLDPDVVLTLQTIRFRDDWSHVQDAVLAYGPLFIEALGEHIRGALGLQDVRARLDPRGRPVLQDLDPELTLPDGFLEYVAPRRPGSAILRRAEDGSLVHAADIDKYVYRGEAVRTAQDPALLQVIRMSGEARRLLTGAAKPGPVDSRKMLIKEATRALERVGGNVYMEFGWGSEVMRDLVRRDVMAAKKLWTGILDPDKPNHLQEDDLEELNSLARSISDRLLRIYRAGEARKSR